MGPASREPTDDDCPERVDPRIARSRAAIVEAAVALLLEGGVHATSVDAIVERAGVSKATLYRHWETRQQLILDALATLKPVPERPGTGSLRGDLVELTTQLVDHLSSPAASVFCSMSGAAEHDTEMAELRDTFATARSQTIRGIVADAIDAGDLPADLDVELFVASIIGPFFYMRLARGETVPRGWPEALVDAALAAHGTRS